MEIHVRNKNEDEEKNKTFKTYKTLGRNKKLIFIIKHNFHNY